jgi:hypothetical protein
MTFFEWLAYFLLRVLMYLITLLSETDENIRVISVNDIISFVNYLL